MASEIAKKLIDELKMAKQNVSGLHFFADHQPCFLRWGETISLHFAKSALAKAKVVCLSTPSRRYEQSVEMMPELMELGGHLFQSLNKRPERTVVIISGDLGHTHTPDGPYGYLPEICNQFDEACGKWASTLNPAYLDEAAKDVKKGLLNASGVQNWRPTLHCNCHPDYYGMMVASFLPKGT